MYLNSLTISRDEKIIRNIEFHKGLNLIIDESEKQITGNNVGKTTVLKLIDFCLGGSPKEIYVSPESKKAMDLTVKNYLIENKILITLVLIKEMDKECQESIKIERNFLARKDKILRINGESFNEDEFSAKLLSLLFPQHKDGRPTFRQIISHNIRYKDLSINNTLKTLDAFSTDVDYEALYLFLFGCETKGHERKQEIFIELNQENTYKRRLEKDGPKTAYETALSIIENEIEELNEKKLNLNLNKDFEKDLESLNTLKLNINRISSHIGQLNIKHDLIIEAEQAINNSKFDFDIKQLEMIYGQATQQISGIQKTFSELVSFHNKMIEEKTKFIARELPQIIKDISISRQRLKQLLQEEEELTSKITKSDSFEDLGKIIEQLNEKFKQKGAYQAIIKQLREADSNILRLNKQLEGIEAELFSEKYTNLVKEQLSKFNKYFSSISDELYGEKYALTYNIVTNKNNKRIYKFDTLDVNLSSGKKQGEISCFDIAYILFADQENIPCLHFLLNDKKELMHDNQLVKIGEIVNRYNIQFVASILRDKLPSELNDDSYFVVKLSQDRKLFRIEG